MTQSELEQSIDRAVQGFSAIGGVDEDLANLLVGEGYLSYDDLSVIEPENLMEMGNLTAEQVDKIVEFADERALEQSNWPAAEKRQRRAQAQGSTTPAPVPVPVPEPTATVPEPTATTVPTPTETTQQETSGEADESKPEGS